MNSYSWNVSEQLQLPFLVTDHNVDFFIVLVSLDVGFVRQNPLPYSKIQFFL